MVESSEVVPSWCPALDDWKDNNFDTEEEREEALLHMEEHHKSSTVEGCSYCDEELDENWRAD